jgi:hypothetical protein
MGYPRKGIVTGLTPSEKLFLIFHPWLIGTIKGDAEKALKEAQVRLPGPGLHNGRGDAFRHCYWAALLARDIGEQDAKEYLDAHEDWADNPPDEKAMDTYNNGQGIAIGKLDAKASDPQLAAKCIEALNAGKLKTL